MKKVYDVRLTGMQISGYVALNKALKTGHRKPIAGHRKVAKFYGQVKIPRLNHFRLPPLPNLWA